MGKRFVFAAMVTAMAGVATAGTVVESQNPSGGTKIYISGNQARIDVSGQDGSYLLVDLHTAQMFLVNQHNKEIYDSGSLPKTAHKSLKGIHLKLDGHGEKIAGYATRVYHLEVNGKYCRTYLVSPAPLKNQELKRFSDFFANHESVDELLGGAMQRSLCERAEDAVIPHLLKHGLPLKTTHGKTVVDEIKSIRTHVHIQTSLFEQPKGYTHKNLSDEMHSAGTAMQGQSTQMSPTQLKQYEQMMQEQLKQMSPAQRKMMEQMMQQQNKHP